MSEKFEKNQTGDSPEKRQALIIEHANAAARYATETDEDAKAILHEHLTAIEERLEMTGDEIAKQALALYKKQYYGRVKPGGTNDSK